jgi:flagellar basal body rod protein FlgB
LESEMLSMSQNTMDHAVETQMVSSSMSRLRTAITGKTS